MLVFEDRNVAGRRLGAALAARGLDATRPLVVGVPRGGLVVAAEAAAVLGASLGAAVVRKVAAPGRPGLAVGAVGPGGVAVVDQALVARLAVDHDWLDAAVAGVRRAVEARVRELGAPLPRVAERTVIVVDDGVATGSTAAAVARWLKHARAQRRILATPVAPPESVARLQREYDEVIALVTVDDLETVGAAYARFDPTPDDELRRLLTPR